MNQKCSDLWAYDVAVKAPCHSVVRAQTGMRSRRFESGSDELSTWNAIVFINVLGIPQLLIPDLFFPPLPLTVQSSSLQTFVRRLNGAVEKQVERKLSVEIVFLPASDRLIRSKGCLMSSVRPVCGEIKLLSIQNDFHLISFDQFLARLYTIQAAEKGSVASLAIITLRRDLIQIIPDKNKHKHCLLRRDKIS